MKGKSLLIYGTVMDLDEFAVGGEEVGPGHADAPVLGDRHSIVIEVVSERQIEFVEEQTRSALAVVVVDADEGNLVAELSMRLTKQWGLGPAGEAPRGPHIDDRRSIEVGQHLLKSRQIDLRQLGRGRFTLVAGTAGCDKDEKNEKTPHPVIMGGCWKSPGVRRVRSLPDDDRMERLMTSSQSGSAAPGGRSRDRSGGAGVVGDGGPTVLL